MTNSGSRSLPKREYRTLLASKPGNWIWFRRVALLLSAAMLAAMLSGCGATGEPTSPSTQPGLAFSGHAHGGQQPVTGATIQLYAAGVTGMGSSATPLLGTSVLTDASGNFSVPAYTCPAPDSQMYLVATGGNPGFAQPLSNPNLSMMAALGPCSAITDSTSVNINEVSSVASVWALAPFMKSAMEVGADQGHLPELVNAFSLVSEFSNPPTGTAPGPNLPAGSTVPVAKIYTLANIFATCINSTGGTASSNTPCGQLFALTTTGRPTAPSSVIDAALDIAKNPTTNVVGIYNLGTAIGPFAPTLSSAPADWTLEVNSPVMAPGISPTGGTLAVGQPVTLSDATPSAVVRYTTDGSVPNVSSPVYMSPLNLPAGGTVQAIALLGPNKSNIAAASFTMSASPGQLVFNGQPSNSSAGIVFASPIVVQVLDSSGMPVTTPVSVAISLGSNAQGATLSGTLQVTAINGVAVFSDLNVNAPGAGYQLQAVVSGYSTLLSNAFAIAPTGVSLTFTPPAENACHSRYDNFYAAEPGVYAFWPLCEASAIPIFYDLVGRNDWDVTNGGWYSGVKTFVTNVPGPVGDGEGAVQVATASSFYAAQNIVLNTNAGTVAVWVNTSADLYLASMLAFEAAGGQSSVWLGAISSLGSTCFQGRWTNSTGTPAYTTSACGYAPNSWHRVALSWFSGQVKLFVDGVIAGTGSYSGSLDNKVFVYQLFPEAGNNGKQMTLAKATLSNQAWSLAQVDADFAAALPTVPAGGVYVSAQQKGTVHRDVLGYVDNQSLLDPAPAAALQQGLKAAGVTSLRYANGSSGIQADQTNWQGGSAANACTSVSGNTQAAMNGGSLDTIDNYIPAVAQPLGLSLGYTVNYGSNPPLCNAGGDPTVNGANLVSYLNKTKSYGFKYFEIGNELYNGGGSEPDFHPKPGDGASYAGYESAFYTAMKGVDPSIQIGIPVGLGHIYNWLNLWSLPAMARSKYDAAIYHNYPTVDPVTDATTLYPERVASRQGTSKADLLTLQTMLLNAGKSPESIWVTEWNDNANGGGPWSRQTLGGASPLFAAMWLSEYMNVGVQWATWFGQYGGTNYCNPFNYDAQAETAYSAVDWCSGSFLVYTGALPGEVNVGFQAGNLSPVGQTFALFRQSGFVTEGEHMLQTSTDMANAPWLLAYAATHGKGTAVILINRDRDVAHTIPVQLASKASGTSVQQWSYGRDQYDQTFQHVWSAGPVSTTLGPWSGSLNATLPAWSVTILLF